MRLRHHQVARDPDTGSVAIERSRAVRHGGYRFDQFDPIIVGRASERSHGAIALARRALDDQTRDFSSTTLQHQTLEQVASENLLIAARLRADYGGLD
jgi:hypothetical protein